jgi:hypothetical protein
MEEEIRKITINFESKNMFDLIGAELHAKGVTSKEFYDAMKSANLLSTPFGNNVMNAIENSEGKTDKLTLKVALDLVEELTQIIKK